MTIRTMKRRWFLGNPGPPWTCEYCGEDIIERGKGRRALCLHHLDWDSKNNDLSNIVPMHLGCHAEYHMIGYVKSPAHRAALSKAQKAVIKRDGLPRGLFPQQTTKRASGHPS